MPDFDFNSRALTAPDGSSPDGSPRSRGLSLRLTETEIDGEWREIRVEGELDLAVADRLDRRLQAATERRTLIDLTPCEFIDATGIAVIVRAHRRVKESDGLLAVHGPRGQVKRVLEILGLSEDGLVFPNRAEALAVGERHRMI